MPGGQPRSWAKGVKKLELRQCCEIMCSVSWSAHSSYTTLSYSIQKVGLVHVFSYTPTNCSIIPLLLYIGFEGQDVQNLLDKPTAVGHIGWMHLDAGDRLVMLHKPTTRLKFVVLFRECFLHT